MNQREKDVELLRNLKHGGPLNEAQAQNVADILERERHLAEAACIDYLRSEAMYMHATGYVETAFALDFSADELERRKKVKP